MSDRPGPDRDRLVAVLVEARALGFVGPGPVEAHLDHAEGFGVALAEGTGPGWAPALVADLGSGAGVPGIPLAVRFPRAQVVLIEANARRALFLRATVRALELDARVRVVEERAEVAGRDPDLRGRCAAAVARGFGPPAVVSECAAPLLRVGGRAVVSEPPGGLAARWPEEGLAELGMRAGPAVAAAGATFQVLEQVAECGSRYPRRTGVPAKRPLF